MLSYSQINSFIKTTSFEIAISELNFPQKDLNGGACGCFCDCKTK